MLGKTLPPMQVTLNKHHSTETNGNNHHERLVENFSPEPIPHAAETTLRSDFLILTFSHKLS